LLNINDPETKSINRGNKQQFDYLTSRCDSILVNKENKDNYCLTSRSESILINKDNKNNSKNSNQEESFKLNHIEILNRKKPLIRRSKFNFIKKSF